MRRMIGSLSRWLNRLTGGIPGQTLCARMGIARARGCVACRWICAVITFLLAEDDHCGDEARYASAADLVKTIKDD